MQPQPHPHLQLKLRPPSPQGFGGGGPAFPPMHGAGIGVGAASSSSSQAAAAGSARAAAQMAYEDAWKASHPDFRTPFSSLEDAVTRLLPYHVFADYEEEDNDGGTEEIPRDEKWDQGVLDTVLEQTAVFEKQVVSFNIVSRQHGEERLMLERALLQDERRATERLRATLVVEHEQQQQRQQQQQEEAARASRLALAQAQAQVASAWPLIPPTASAWQQALAAAATGRGEGVVPGQVEAAAYGQLDPATASAWLMMHQQHQQQQHQHHQQQHQQLVQLGAWPTYAAPVGGGNPMGQAGPSTVWQEQTGEQAMLGGTAAGGMAQPWWLSGAQREQ